MVKKPLCVMWVTNVGLLTYVRPEMKSQKKENLKRKF